LALFPILPVWHAKAEPKCKFFTWLVLHNKLLTADNMLKRNWECNPICSLCLCLHETTEDLLIECNFSEAVWNSVVARFALPDYEVMIGAGGTGDWVQKLLSSGSKSEKRRNLGILFMTWWEIWNERNRRIFDLKLTSATQVSAFAIDRVRMWDQAFARDPED
jgi:hypothetical protein